MKKLLILLLTISSASIQSMELDSSTEHMEKHMELSLPAKFKGCYQPYVILAMMNLSSLSEYSQKYAEEVKLLSCNVIGGLGLFKEKEEMDPIWSDILVLLKKFVKIYENQDRTMNGCKKSFETAFTTAFLVIKLPGPENNYYPSACVCNKAFELLFMLPNDANEINNHKKELLDATNKLKQCYSKRNIKTCDLSIENLLAKIYNL